MSVENNIEVVQRLGEALSSRDWAVFEELVAEDCEWTDVPSGRTIRGAKDLVDACRTFTTAFPDFSVESMTLIGQGDIVANEWSARTIRKIEAGLIFNPGWFTVATIASILGIPLEELARRPGRPRRS